MNQRQLGGAKLVSKLVCYLNLPAPLKAAVANAATAARLYEKHTKDSGIETFGQRYSATCMNRDLFAAAIGGDVVAVHGLIARGADVSASNAGGMTPLMMAVGCTEILSLLLRAGADACAVAKQPWPGFSALYMAAQDGRIESVRLLLRYGAASLYKFCDCTRGLLPNPITAIVTSRDFKMPRFKRIVNMMAVSGVFDESKCPYQRDMELRPKLTNSELKAAAFDLQRDRMAEICMALQSMHLPALLLVLILREACVVTDVRLRFSHCWAVATKIKHTMHYHPPTVK